MADRLAVDGAHRLGDHHQREGPAARLHLAQLAGHAVERVWELGDQADVGATGDRGVNGDMPGVAPHHLQHHDPMVALRGRLQPVERLRSEEHTSELQSLMRTSYAVFCLKKKTKKVLDRA